MNISWSALLLGYNRKYHPDFNWLGLRKKVNLQTFYDEMLVSNDRSIYCSNLIVNGSNSGPKSVYRGEFGYELQGVLPWYFALCQASEIESQSLSGMEPYYFWSKNHVTISGHKRNDGDILPPANPLHSSSPHIPLAKFPNSSMWMMPKFRDYYMNDLFKFTSDKKTVLIRNKFNKEWGGDPINYFDESLLRILFDEYIKNDYNIIYKRPVSKKLLNDDIEQIETNQLRHFELINIEYGDTVLSYSDILNNIEHNTKIELSATWMNLIQLSIMANVDEFVSVQGGNSVLSSMFCAGNHIIYFQKGSEYNAGDFFILSKIGCKSSVQSQGIQQETGHCGLCPK